MPELSFSTFAEFINAVDRANRLGTELPALTARVESLRREEVDLAAKNKVAALAVDNAKKEAAALVDKGEANRLEREEQGKKDAKALIERARTTADAVTAAANKKLADIREDTKKAEADLVSVVADISNEKVKLAAIQEKIDSLQKVFGGKAA